MQKLWINPSQKVDEFHHEGEVYQKGEEFEVNEKDAKALLEMTRRGMPLLLPAGEEYAPPQGEAVEGDNPEAEQGDSDKE